MNGLCQKNLSSPCSSPQVKSGNQALETIKTGRRLLLNKSSVTLFVIYSIFIQTVVFSTFQQPVFAATRTGVSADMESTKARQTTILPVIPAIISRHRPTLNSGTVEGSLRLLTGESFNINGGITITELLVPGTPAFTFNGGTHGAIVSDGGATTPTGYPVTMNGGTISGKIHKQSDPIIFPTDIPASVPNATGTRSVNINSTADVNTIGNWQTVANLTVNVSNITVTVPPGNYNSITLNGAGSAVKFSSGAYNFASTLTINSNSRIESTGAVTINIRQALTLNTGKFTLGANTLTGDVRLNILGATANVNASCEINAQVRIPNGTLTMNGSTALLRGIVWANYFTLNGGRVTGDSCASDGSGCVGVPSLVSIAPLRATEGQTLQVNLNGSNTHWVAGQTQASFGGEISVGGAPAGQTGPITVTSATTAVAALVISPKAALAPRTARIVTTPGSGGGETVELVDVFTVLPVSPPGATANNVRTIAGVAGQFGFADGAGTLAKFKDLAGLAVGADDAVYIADAGNHRIRVAREQANGTWNVQTLAGSGTAGFADGVGTSAKFNNPQAVAVGWDNAVYVADAGNHRIRRIAPDGMVSTVAGTGVAGFQNGAGAQAQFNNPRGIAADTAGNIYVADTGNSAVRRIDASGTVTTVAGNGTAGANDSPDARFNGLAGITVDGDQVYIYIADGTNHRIRRLDATGSVMTLTGAERGFADGYAADARFAEPTGLAIDATGRLIIADSINSLIRAVSPGLSINNSPLAVTTVAGAGERGSADGGGGTAKFNLPRGVAVSRSSAIIIADTGNQTLRRIGLAPQIGSFAPASARVNETVTIYGDNFDGRATTYNPVAFAKTGGGTVTASVTSATRTQLTVVVPAQAATGRITVTTPDGTATSANDFQVQTIPLPVITDFTPRRGQVGIAVKLVGTGLKDGSANPMVTFKGSGNSRLNALVNSATATEVNVLVPNGAVTGFINLTTAGGNTQTPQEFVVDDTQEFQITVAPSTIQAVDKTTGTAIVSLTSSNQTFTQLAKLSITGLPNGVTAEFTPQNITAGATSTLKLNLQNSTAPVGSYSLMIKGAAIIDGHEVIKQTTASLSILAAGQTTISGRVLNTDSEPVIGATVSLDGRTVTTDASGSFTLSGVTAGTARPLQIDGRTASAPNRTYPVITEPANIAAGVANQVPYIFYLPPVDTQYEVTVVPGQNTIAGNPKVEGLKMTIPAGANLRNRDGSPITRVSITPLAIDRTPTPLPSNVSMGLVYTSQPGGALTDKPIPVTYPNLLGKTPGTVVELYAFNHDTVQWYIYGYGTVSPDGKVITPNIDPNTNQPYGLRDFSWHGPNAGQDGNPGGGGGDGCPSNVSENPVDASTGIKLESMTDISFGGSRGKINLTRYYSSDNAGQAVVGRFSRGWKDNYEISLNGNWSVGGAGRVVRPNEQVGRLFSYKRTDPNGTLIFSSSATITQLSDVIRKFTNGNLEYRSGSGDKMTFASDGRLLSMQDRNGNATTLNYSGSRLTQITDAVGRSITYTYDGSNRVSKVTDPLGRDWIYTYTETLAYGALDSVTDPAGNKTQYRYANLRINQIIDPRGNTVKTITHDSSGRVIKEKFADGGIETYEYQLSGAIVTQTKITDPLGRVTIKRFNANGYVLENTDPLGQTARVDRNLNNNLAKSTSGSCGCAEQSYQYDESGNILSQTDREGQTSQMEYVADTSYINKVTDKTGQSYNFIYDANGNVTAFTDSIGRTTRMTFDSFGQMTSTTNVLNQTSRMEYDAQGNLTGLIDPLGHRTSVEYDAIGRRTAIVDALGRRKEVIYDSVDRITSFKDTSGAVTQYEYDANDNLIKVTDALGRIWKTGYDAKNRTTSATDPIERIIRYQYTKADEVKAVITPEGRNIKYLYNNRSELEKITDPSGNFIDYAYDYKGNLLSVGDQRGSITSYTYDTLFRPIARTNPLGQRESVKYNQYNQITEATDVLGRKRTTTYDTLGRPIATAFADSQMSYEYDALGRTTRINDSVGGAVSWTYDAANRIAAETSPNGTVAYTYNNADEKTSMTAGNRASVIYGYDAAGRLNQIKQGSEQFGYSYDLLSRMNGLSRPNAVTTSYDYDTVGRLSRLKHTDGSGQAIEDYNYSYTSDDQIAGITSLLPANNLETAKTYGTADAANRIRQVGDATYTFDDVGQISSKTTQQGITRYNWDARGRLTQAVLPDGQSVGYNYDALGRLAKRTVGSEQTAYLYDGADVVADQKSNGATVDYLNGAGIDDKLRQSTAATGSLYFQTDHLGSTTALTNSAGNVVERQSYTPFGNSSGSSQTRYGFTGREKDSATGLLYYRARWYDAEQGRFMSEDPIGFDGGMNFYAYAGNSPTNFVDPMGTSLWTFTKGLVSGAGWSIVAAIGGGAIAALVSCLTGGAAVPALVSAIVALAGGVAMAAAIYEAAMELANLIVDILMGTVCWDDVHYRIGYLIGSFIGDLIGGRLAKNLKFCFVAGTLVQTRDGTKPIEEIKKGDEVLSYNEQTGENEYQKVLQTFTRYAEDVLSIKIVGESEPIGVTSGHPFFVRVHGARSDTSSEGDDGEWRRAGELQIGDVIRTAAGDWARVESVEERGKEQVYNFEVERNHNYFVGGQGLLVHNGCGDAPPNLTPEGGGRKGAFKQAKRDAGIPTSQQPSVTGPNFDRRGNLQPGRQYDFDVPAPGGGTRRVGIRDDSGGHYFGPGDPQNRGPHFNGGGNTHYDY